MALYEESLWTLYALQDDLMQADNPFKEEDKVTISTCKQSITPNRFSYANIAITF